MLFITQSLSEEKVNYKAYPTAALQSSHALTIRRQANKTYQSAKLSSLTCSDWKNSGVVSYQQDKIILKYLNKRVP